MIMELYWFFGGSKSSVYSDQHRYDADQQA